MQRENEEEMSVPVGVSRMETLVASPSVLWTAHVSAGCSSEDVEVGTYLNVQFRNLNEKCHVGVISSKEWARGCLLQLRWSVQNSSMPSACSSLAE